MHCCSMWMGRGFSLAELEPELVSKNEQVNTAPEEPHFDVDKDGGGDDHGDSDCV